MVTGRGRVASGGNDSSTVRFCEGSKFGRFVKALPNSTVLLRIRRVARTMPVGAPDRPVRKLRVTLFFTNSYVHLQRSRSGGRPHADASWAVISYLHPRHAASLAEAPMVTGRGRVASGGTPIVTGTVFGKPSAAMIGLSEHVPAPSARACPANRLRLRLGNVVRIGGIFLETRLG